MRAISRTSGVVTRNPPLNSPSTPSFFSIALICGPPPCTTTGWIPQLRRNTMSSAKAFFSASSVIALPPYFMTTMVPCSFLSHGSAPASTAAFFVAFLVAFTSCTPSSLRHRRATDRWCGWLPTGLRHQGR
ncbi:Uncharacterised protein [Mycobacteroides abscessus subsp. abscessus]|nr:Uncharacterised protein [Mycobacteroides abscessus subsp. abscessus]